MSPSLSAPAANPSASTILSRNASQIVARARHDLRNPIGHILGFTDILLEEARSLGYAHFVADLESINQAANTMIVEINVCLDSEKIEIDADDVRRLKEQLRALASKVIFTAESMSHMSKALKEDIFSEDLTRISASARQTVELSETALAFVSEAAVDEAVAPRPAPQLAPALVTNTVVQGGPETECPKQGSILVVDDLMENRELLLRRLSRMGYTMQAVENGQKALEFIASNPVDLVLLDLVMPVMDGFQTLARLKENPATRYIPVIMLSSSDETANVVHCIKLGADDFLPKPFNTTLLLARIDSSLAKKRLRDLDKAQATFYFDKGTLQHDSPSYVERRADKELFDGLTGGEFCYVLTSRQMGKSSLMVRTANKLRGEGINVVALDLTAIGQNLTPEQWYDGLAMRMGRQLRLEDELEDYWLGHKRLSPVQRLFTAIREVVLKHRSPPLVIFVDELDTVRSLPFSTDEFFAAIRECYNRRTEDPEFSRLTFCLLGVATPSDLIRDSRTTPFTLGRRIELADFAPAEATPLANGLGRERKVAEALLERILYWTDGHPYLTQRFCRAIAQDVNVTKPSFVDRVCERLFLSARAREEDDNLVFVRKMVLRSEADLPSLLKLYSEIRRRRKKVPDDEANHLVNILRLSGIVRIAGGVLQVRNRIYARVFDPDWIKANLA